MCIWDGPHYMRVKYSLLPALSDANNATLTAFFVDTLQMKNVSCKNLTDELADIKKYVRNTANIHDIYIRLQTMATYLSAAELDAVR
jgi:hypothetical protein